MGFMDSLKKAIQGPARIGGDDPGEIAADLQEEYIPSHAEDSELEEVKELEHPEAPAPGALPGFAAAGGDVAGLDETTHEREIEEEVESGLDPDGETRIDADV